MWAAFDPSKFILKLEKLKSNTKQFYRNVYLRPFYVCKQALPITNVLTNDCISVEIIRKTNYKRLFETCLLKMTNLLPKNQGRVKRGSKDN